MHKDTKEALERLEAELLAQEEVPELDDDELDALLEEFLDEDDGEFADHPAGYQNFANGYRAYNSDDADTDLDVYSDEVYQEPEEISGGMLALVLVALVGAVAALVFVAVRIL